jgi:hypothetical protein
LAIAASSVPAGFAAFEAKLMPVQAAPVDCDAAVSTTVFALADTALP